MVYKSLIRPQIYLGKLRMSCKVSFFYLQFGSKYDHLCHAHINMRSRIWFELSDRGATLPHVTRKVAQNTRPSFSHMWEGLGTRLILGVDVTDTWYRFALWLPGLAAWMLAHHTRLLAKLSSLHVSQAVPWLLALFLVAEQPPLCPKVHNHPAHSTLASSNSAVLLPLALEKANHGLQIFALEPAPCLCWSKSWSAWLSKVIQCPNTPWAMMRKRRLPEIGTGVWGSGKQS